MGKIVRLGQPEPHDFRGLRFHGGQLRERFDYPVYLSTPSDRYACSFTRRFLALHAYRIVIDETSLLVVILLCYASCLKERRFYSRRNDLLEKTDRGSEKTLTLTLFVGFPTNLVKKIICGQSVQSGSKRPVNCTNC